MNNGYELTVMGNLASVGRLRAVNMTFGYFPLINLKFGGEDKSFSLGFRSLCLDFSSVMQELLH